jgi:hypothetical protein
VDSDRQSMFNLKTLQLDYAGLSPRGLLLGSYVVRSPIGHFVHQPATECPLTAGPEPNSIEDERLTLR